MYRDDLAATHARVEGLQRELREASSQTAHDKQRIAALTAQISALQQALARMGQVQYQAPSYPSYVFPPRSGTILTLGILSLVVCSVLGPVAWAMGNEELRRIDAGQTSPGSRGTASAGRICGIVGSAILMFAGFMVFVGVALASGHH